jgi:hypothetical protein
MSTFKTIYDAPDLGGQAVDHDARALLGQVMGQSASSDAAASNFACAAASRRATPSASGDA